MENNDRLRRLEEAYRRGILPAEKIPIYEEAMRRGLVAQDKRPQKDESISWSDVPGKAIENFIPSGKKAVGDIVDVVTSPVETAKSLGNLALGAVQKVIPGEYENEKYANAFGRYFADRYGSAEGFKKALAYDPVGVASDVAAALTGVGGVAKAGAKGAQAAKMAGAAAKLEGTAKTAFSAARAVDPLTLPLKGAGYAAKGFSNIMPDALKVSPERLYQSALKPSTTLSPSERAGVLRTGLSEKIPPNAAGYEKLQRIIDELGAEAAGLVDYRARLEKTGAAPKTIDPSQIVQKSSDFLTESLGYSPDAKSALSSADEALGKFLESHGGRGNLDTATAQKIKQRAQLEAAKSFGEPLTTPVQDTKKSLAHGLREGIEANVPEIAPINQRLQKLYDLAPEVARAAGRTGNWNIFSLNSGVNSGVGAVIGGAIGGPVGAIGGAAIGNIASNIARQPGTKARAAFALDALTSPGAKQALEAIERYRTPVGASMYGAGRANDIIEEISPQRLSGKEAILRGMYQ